MRSSDGSVGPHHLGNTRSVQCTRNEKIQTLVIYDSGSLPNDTTDLQLQRIHERRQLSARR